MTNEMLNDGEPGMPPALPAAADIERNLSEWKSEVRASVRAMVCSVVDDHRHPSPESLRRLGPDGRLFYYRSLREAVDRDLSAYAGSGPGHHADVDQGAWRTTSTPLLLSSVNWKDRRLERPGYRRRGMVFGFEIAAVLTSVAVFALHPVSQRTFRFYFLRLLEVLS